MVEVKKIDAKDLPKTGEKKADSRPEKEHEKKESVKLLAEPKTISEQQQDDLAALLESSKISLWIDSYEEIFSDFDPRPYSIRDISTDFIDETKRFSRESLKEKIELTILMPKDIRDKKMETVIKKRLRKYFSEQNKRCRKNIFNVVKQGSVFVFLGTIFMLVTTFILIDMVGNDPLITFLGVLGEPAGWFFFWEGSRLLVFDRKALYPDYERYSKMAKLNVGFGSY